MKEQDPGAVKVLHHPLIVRNKAVIQVCSGSSHGIVVLCGNLCSALVMPPPA